MTFYPPAYRSEMRWMFSAASVCLSVSLSVCLHDNFRTIQHRTLTVRCIVQKCCPNSNVKVKDQGHKGQKLKTAESSPLTAHSRA